MASRTDAKYEKIPLKDDLPDVDDIFGLDGIEDAHISSEFQHKLADDSFDGTIVVRNEKPFPISKPPPQHRDWSYALVFVLHFLAVLVLTILEQDSLQRSLLEYNRASSWASMIMIVTLLGSFVGAVVAFLIGNMASLREPLLSSCIPFSFVLKICVGNILLIMRSGYSLLAVVILLSLLLDAFSYQSARGNVSFTSTLMQMVVDCTRPYGMSFVIVCAAIIFMQTCILLWWGAFFIGMVSTASAATAGVLIPVMFLSLCWITQFFHALTSFVVGGCVVWIFLKQGDPMKFTDEDSDLSHKLSLYLRCAMTTSLGSICKGALFVPAAHYILALHHWLTRKPEVVINPYSFRGVLLCVLPYQLVVSAQQHHRLTYCLLATYGRAFCSTANDHLHTYGETLELTMEDSTYFITNSIATALAGVVAIVFALIADRGEGHLWPLFFFVCFYLAYSGVSLAVHVYSSAIDALIVASALQPVQFAKENQIVFLRFLRTTDHTLR